MNETQTLSPQDAAAALQGLEDLEQTLSYKAGAISWMLFGLAGAAIFATYGMVGPWFETIGMPWLYSFLWIPWIAAATAGTKSLWRMMNISMERPADEDLRHTGLYTFGYSLLFLLIGAGIFLILDRLVGLALSMHVTMTMTIGVFTAGLAVFQSRHYCAPMLRAPFLLAGAALFAVGVTMAVVDPSEVAAGLTATFASLLAYFTAALYVFRRG